MRVTVGISTWNRAEHLDRTLASMLEMRIPKDVAWELLVVNNNCTDATDVVIASYRDRLPIRRLFEPRQGKSHACNLLVREASGELILWTDDDVRVAPDWMEQYVIAARERPAATYFGGTIDPMFEAPPPNWVLRALPQLCAPLVILQLGNDVRLLRSGEYPYGANMAIRSSVFRVHRFDENLGPTGERLRRGEETRLISTLCKAGHEGVWVGPAKVRHWVPRERMTQRYVWDWHYGAGVTWVRELRDIAGRQCCGVPLWALRQYVQQMLAYACSFFFGRDGKCIRALGHWASGAGVLAECRRRSRSAAARIGTVAG